LAGKTAATALVALEEAVAVAVVLQLQTMALVAF
jgi:hypothetical protein